MKYIFDDLKVLEPCLRKAKSDKNTELYEPLKKYFDQLFNISEFGKSTPPPIFNIFMGANIQSIFNKSGQNAYVLYTETVSGGTNKVSRNLIFGTKLRHSGGVIHYYSLIDKNGSIKFSDIDIFYTGFQKIEPTDKEN